MPHSQSALKRVRQSVTREGANHSGKARLKTLSRQYLELIEKKDIETAKITLKNVFSGYDKAVKRGFIKKNLANRKKSRLSLLLNKVSQ